MAVRDGEIRTALLDRLDTLFPGDRVCPEMGLCLGETRVDVAVVNGHLHGFEIKSERDTLTRLRTQVEIYDRVLDYATVVSSPRHLENVERIVPKRWGLMEAVPLPDGEIALRRRRRGTLNHEQDPLSVAQLLWREEAAGVLVARGETVHRRETRWQLWARLAKLPLHELKAAVRETLKARPDWLGR